MQPDELRKSIHGYMPQLDALRGIAILWVILHNAALDNVGDSQSIVMSGITLVGNTGWAGVQLFFVLSGFLITGILLNNRGANNVFRNFYARRTLRIFPVYFFFLLLALTVFPLTDFIPSNDSSGLEKILYFTYLSNWALLFDQSLNFPHLWSLAIEEQYYLVWPFLVIFLSKRTLVYVCIALIISAVLLRSILVLEFDPEFSSKAMYTFTFARWDSLAIGSLLAILVRSESTFTLLQRYFTFCFIALSALLSLQILLLRNFSATDIVGIFNQTTIAIWFAMLILLSIIPWNNQLDRVRPILSNKLLCRIGKYSYATYLFHFPVKLVWFKNFSIDVVPNAPLNQLGVVFYNFTGISIITISIAYLSWHILEQPFLKLKNRFSMLR